MTIEEAVEIVRQHLQKKTVDPVQAYVYTWTTMDYGIRVAECGWATMTAGACYMASDPDGLAVCAAVERAVIALTESDDRGKMDSEADRQLDVLDFLLGRGAP